MRDLHLFILLLSLALIVLFLINTKDVLDHFVVSPTQSRLTVTVKRDDPTTATDQRSDPVPNKKPPRILFLHIGPPKTGTSTIQDSFDANPEPLMRDGYKYLGIREPAPKRDKFGVRSGLSRFHQKKNKSFINKLIEEMNREDFGNLILSAEVSNYFTCR